MQKGFSLIETIIAISVLVIGIVGVLQMFSLAIRTEGLARKTTIASYYGQGRIEELISCSYDDPQLSKGSYSTTTSDGYQIDTVIDYVDPDNNLESTTTDLGIKKAKVTVSWGTGPQKKIDIVSLISER